MPIRVMLGTPPALSAEDIPLRKIGPSSGMVAPGNKDACRLWRQIIATAGRSIRDGGAFHFRSVSGFHPLVNPLPIAAVAKASCIRKCCMSSISVSIAARLSPSCHAMMWSTGSASGSRLSGRTFSFSGSRVQIVPDFSDRHTPPRQAMFLLRSNLGKSQCGAVHGMPNLGSSR